VWSDDAPGNPNIFFRHSADGGETFDAVQNLSDTRGNALHPRVAASGSKIYVVWQDCNPLCFPVDVFFRSSSNDGTSFNPTLNLSEDGGSALPELAVSTSNVYVIWKNFLVGNGDVFFRGTLVPPTNKCPLGQGFWKNHPDAWPVTSLTLGSQTYTQAELLALFDTPPRGDASLILAHQLIAAKLNIANGSNPTPVSATITDADSLLSQFGNNRLPYNVRTSSAIGQQMVNDANVLDRYNNGDLTPDCQP